MKVFELCDEVLVYSEWDAKAIHECEYEWFVSWYESDPYDGRGEAVGYKDGVLYFYDLGHCSCYGPLDSGPESVSVEVYLKSNSVHDTDTQYKEVREKVMELLS